MTLKNLFKKSFLIFCSSISLENAIIAQSSTLSHLGFSTVSDWCGWQNNVIPFNIEHRGNKDINFLTAGTVNMTINGSSAGVFQGYVGIGGIANNRLDVFAGDIDVNSGRRSYMIGYFTVTDPLVSI